MVITALALFGLMSLLTFAIDISHWFDYSRNLQNRADAAALAAADEFGNTCFQGSYGSPWTGAQSTIGKWAQLYSGPGTGEPFDGGANPGANVPYSDSDVWSATGVTPQAYNNVPNLTAGSLNDYYVLLNSANYIDKGGTNFSMGVTDPNVNGGLNQAFCNSDPTLDATDKQCFGQTPGQTSGPCAVGPMADVKVTQMQLPNFIPIFNVHPNISAHARVALQGIASEKGVRPLAVGDASYIPCVTANFLNADGSTIVSEKLIQQKDAKGNPTGVWDSTKDAKSVSMPSGRSPVTVEMFLNDCVSSGPSGTKYDYVDANGNSKKLGLVYINNWGSPASPAPVGGEIAGQGVTLVGPAGASGTPCDPYFQSSSGNCSADVDAHVAFPAPGSGVSYYVRAVDAGSNTSCNPAGGQSCNSIDLVSAGGTDWQSALNTTGPFSFGSDSGPHSIDIWTAQLGGSIGGKNCNTGTGIANAWATSNKNCWTDLGTQQRAFSGINGTNLCSDPQFDTGPMQWITVGEEDAAGNILATSGANAYGGSASPHLFITTSIAGLSNSAAGDPAICLRVAESTSHDTGLIICPPQTSGGTQQDIQGIVNGCDNIQINTRLQPDGSLTCTPTITPNDCVTNDTGQTPPILGAFDKLICQSPTDPNPKDNWPNVDITDPRSLVMIITAPVDFTKQNGTTQQPTIPIRNFAVFYVTGWSTGQGGVQGCSNNEPPPAGAGNGEIWGHWTSLEVPSGLATGNGETCKAGQFGNCVAVLTR